MSQQAWVRDSERPFVRLAEDWATQVTSKHRWVLTDFLTPREQYLAESVSNRHGLVHRFYGGYEDAERQRMLLMPEDWYPQSDDFEVAALQLESLESDMRHKDVMGSVLGLGIQRKAIGDIAVDSKTAYVFVTKSISSFLVDSLHQVGRSSVSLILLDEPPHLPKPYYEERDITVKSLRLDAVVAHACNLSRSHAQTAVLRGHVTLNFAEATSRDDIADGDILSLRGFGRVKILEVMGSTRRERIRLRVGILRSDA